MSALLANTLRRPVPGALLKWDAVVDTMLRVEAQHGVHIPRARGEL
jgi:hypothetical protein